jgi:glycerol 3-phosphatase-2
MTKQAFDLARYDAAVFDLDGTVWLGEDPIPGAAEFVDECRDRGLTVTFATNATALSAGTIAEKLIVCGLGQPGDGVVTGGIVVASSLAARRVREVVAVAPPAMVDAITASGVAVLDPADLATSDWSLAADRAVAIGAYREATVGALETIGRLHAHGHPLFVTSLDPSFPGKGRLEPGGGTLVAAVSAMYPTAPIVLGKPSEAYAAVVAESVRSTGRIVMFGDSQRADIGTAHLLDADSVFITGPRNTQVRDDLPFPTFVTERLGKPTLPFRPEPT